MSDQEKKMVSTNIRMINYTKGFNTLLYNDFIVNIYAIGLGTSFYKVLVPLHTNTLIT